MAIAGSEGFSGLAATTGTLGAAILAIPLARLAQSRGRRVSLTTGAILAALGGLLVIASAGIMSLPLLLIGLTLMGAAQALNLQARFAAADLAADRTRGRDLSLVVWSTTIGVVLGPNLFEPGEVLGARLGLPEMSGGFAISMAAQLVGIVLFLVFLRPDPLLTAAFLTCLARARQDGALDGDPLTDAAARDWAVRDWRRTLKNTRTRSGTHLGAATINNRLAAVDAFFALRGSGRPAVVREHLARPSAPRALDQHTLLRLLRTVARDASPRDRVICHLAYYAGLRVAEIVALDVADIRLSVRKGSVRVRGKGRSGGKDRTVPLHAQVRTILEALLDGLGRPAADPLIRNRDGRALSTRAANTIVCVLGAAAGIGPADDGEAFGPHVLRHTFGTDLVRGRGEVAAAPVDVVLVAELMDHADINTTRRYALPTDAEKTRALEALTTDR